jgi:hypothetical protein
MTLSAKDIRLQRKRAERAFVNAVNKSQAEWAKLREKTSVAAGLTGHTFSDRAEGAPDSTTPKLDPKLAEGEPGGTCAHHGTPICPKCGYCIQDPEHKKSWCSAYPAIS